MSRELKFQSDLINSAKYFGGYGRKMAHKFQVGIPDLHILLPGLEPWIVEAKWLDKKPDPLRTFTIGTTAKQRHELHMMEKSGSKIRAFVIVGWEDGKENKAAAFHHSITSFTGVPTGIITRQKGLIWPLMEWPTP